MPSDGSPPCPFRCGMSPCRISARVPSGWTPSAVWPLWVASATQMCWALPKVSVETAACSIPTVLEKVALAPFAWPGLACHYHKARQSVLVQDQRSAEGLWIPDMRPLASQGCTRLEGMSHLNSQLLFYLIRLSCPVGRWLTTTAREAKRPKVFCV